MNEINRRVAVVGAGLMGVGIASCLALAGEAVDVFDLSEARRAELPALADKIFEELMAAGRIAVAERDAARTRIRVVADLAALADASLVFEASNYAMVYNKALLKGTPPSNFDEFLAAAKAATAAGNYGYAYRATMAERGGFWYDLCNYVYGFGGRWSDEQGNPTINSAKVIEGVAAYKKVYDAGAIPKGADAATYRRMFAEGKIAMQVDNGGVAANLATQAKGFEFGATPSPFPTKAQGMILAPISINANSKNKAAAGAFLQWMLTPEAQRELQLIHGASSVAIAVPRSAEEVAKWPWISVYDQQTANSVPALPQGLEVKAPEIQQIVIEQVIKVLQGGVDPAKAMNDAQQTVLSRVLKR